MEGRERRNPLTYEAREVFPLSGRTHLVPIPMHSKGGIATPLFGFLRHPLLVSSGES
jgi:hypothetical protein